MFEESAVFHAPTSCAGLAALMKKCYEFSETEQSRSLNSKTDGSPRQYTREPYIFTLCNALLSHRYPRCIILRKPTSKTTHPRHIFVKGCIIKSHFHHYATHFPSTVTHVASSYKNQHRRQHTHGLNLYRVALSSHISIIMQHIPFSALPTLHHLTKTHIEGNPLPI